MGSASGLPGSRTCALLLDIQQPEFEEPTGVLDRIYSHPANNHPTPLPHALWMALTNEYLTNVYTVRRILDVRCSGRGFYNLMDWGCYSTEAICWVPPRDILDRSLVVEFHRKRGESRTGVSPVWSPGFLLSCVCVCGCRPMSVSAVSAWLRPLFAIHYLISFPMFLLSCVSDNWGTFVPPWLP